jgi:hypothetical protein
MAIASIEELYEWRTRRNSIEETLQDFGQPGDALMRFVAVKILGPIVAASKEVGATGTMMHVQIHAADALDRIKIVTRANRPFGQYDFDFVYNRLSWTLQSIDEWIAENS